MGNIRKATDCQVTACVANHVHVEFLGDDGKPFAELVCADVDEATRLIMKIERECDEIMKGAVPARPH